MNTRNKIVTAADLPVSPCVIVIGTFDPMLAAHAVRLQQLRGNGPLVAAIADSAEPILPLRARLELVAGLRVVDFVLPYVDGMFPRNLAITDDRELHARWSSDFIQHVRRRSQQA
jgi:hypothetical protein